MLWRHCPLSKQSFLSLKLYKSVVFDLQKQKQNKSSFLFFLNAVLSKFQLSQMSICLGWCNKIPKTNKHFLKQFISVCILYYYLWVPLPLQLDLKAHSGQRPWPRHTPISHCEKLLNFFEISNIFRSLSTIL